MTTTPIPEAPLSPHRAFVVQRREGPALTVEARHGRVEPLASGQAARLTSPEALRAFTAQVLTSPGRAPGGGAAPAATCTRASSRQRRAAVARGQRYDRVETRHQAHTAGRHDPRRNGATGRNTRGCNRKPADSTAVVRAACRDVARAGMRPNAADRQCSDAAWGEVPDGREVPRVGVFQ
jgi:hypothetical protein